MKKWLWLYFECDPKLRSNALETLIGAEIYGPVVDSFGPGDLWRVHRHDVEDEPKGCQVYRSRFRLLCYVDPEQHDWIRSAIVEHRLIPEIKILGAECKEDIPGSGFPDDDPRCGVENHWPAGIQIGWTQYIQGVSACWLEMVRHYRDKFSQGRLGPTASMNTMLDVYSDVSNAVIDDWKLHGQQPFLHHLNAILYFEPIELKTENGTVAVKF